MPELPDLRAYSINLNKQFAQKTLKHLNIANPQKLDAQVPQVIQELTGATLQSISQQGKELYFYFDNKKHFALHLMLTGRMELLDSMEPRKESLLLLDFDKAGILHVYDGLAWANLKYMAAIPTVPDAMSDELTVDYLRATIVRRKKKTAKEYLIDQKVIRGIGNAYADEILYHALVSPESHMGALPAAVLEQLIASIRKVLVDAEQQILRIKPTIISGEERSFLKVHHKSLKETASGYPVLKKNIGKKKTYYTQEQKLYV